MAAAKPLFAVTNRIRMKKILFAVHKYLGIALSILFVIWFISGFVMMFSSFPKAQKEAYAKKNSPITENIDLKKIETGKSIVIQKRLKNLEIVREDSAGKKTILSYPSLKPIGSYGLQSCIEMAKACTQSEVTKVETINDFDMWIPWMYLKEHFPIYKCWMNDGKGTVMYLSSKTGQIVQETNSHNRFWSYFGAIPHWVYIKQLRLHIDSWKNTVIALSALGSIMCLAGLMLGIMLIKKKSLSPYRKKRYRWHHLLGLLFGLSTFTYIFSGMMSLCDIPDFIAKQPEMNEEQSADTLPLKRYTRDIAEAIRLYPRCTKLELKLVGGKPFYKMTDAAGNEEMVSGDSSIRAVRCNFSKMEALKEYKSYINGKKYTIELQTKYNNYYMPKKRGIRPLPVYVLKVNDKYQSAYYINPKTLEIISSQSKNSRIQRWTYNFLHCYDSYWLINRPAIRRSIEIFLMIGGLSLSISSLILTIRRIKRKKR